MRVTIKISLLLFFTLIFNSVFSQINNDSIIIPHEEIRIKCMQIKPDEYVIRSETEYQELLSERSQHPNCYDYEFPYIDFDIYTLLVYYGAAGGNKKPDILYEVIKINKNYIVNIEIIQYGYLKGGRTVKICCLIPKIDIDTNVDFFEKRIRKGPFLPVIKNNN